jgi:hypothetical protein
MCPNMIKRGIGEYILSYQIHQRNGIIIKALHDLNPGEELTINYLVYWP